MNVLQLVIYIYVALVCLCLVIVTTVFVKRRIISRGQHRHLISKLGVLVQELKTASSQQRQELTTNMLSDLVLPIGHYGWSNRARKELEQAISALSDEANRIAATEATEKLNQERTSRAIAEDTEAVTQKAEKAAARAENAAKKSEEVVNRAADLTRMAADLVEREAASAREAARLRAGVTSTAVAVRQRLEEAIKKLEEKAAMQGATAEQRPTAEETAFNIDFATIFFRDLPAVLASVITLFSKSPSDERLVLRARIAELADKHRNQAEFESEARRLIDDMTRRAEQRGLIAQEGETEVSG
jgi:hypothetical protein